MTEKEKIVKYIKLLKNKDLGGIRYNISPEEKSVIIVCDKKIRYARARQIEKLLEIIFDKLFECAYEVELIYAYDSDAYPYTDGLEFTTA